jgi:hypothetical protein
VFFKNDFNSFDEILVLYGDHLLKWNCIGGIFRKITVYELSNCSKPSVPAGQISVLCCVQESAVVCWVTVDFVSEVTVKVNFICGVVSDVFAWILILFVQVILSNSKLQVTWHWMSFLDQFLLHCRYSDACNLRLLLRVRIIRSLG